MTLAQATPVPHIDYRQIVALIRAGDPAGSELLFNTFYRGLRFLAARYCPHLAEDCAQETILAVMQQIERGKIEHPEALPGYVRTILKRIAWDKKKQCERLESEGAAFEKAPDRREDPHRAFEIKQRAEILQCALRTLKPRAREVLRRFYLSGESKEQICQAMNLTETSFRLLKSRSKQMLEEAAARELRRRNPEPARLAFAS